MIVSKFMKFLYIAMCIWTLIFIGCTILWMYNNQLFVILLVTFIFGVLFGVWSVMQALLKCSVISKEQKLP